MSSEKKYKNLDNAVDKNALRDLSVNNTLVSNDERILLSSLLDTIGNSKAVIKTLRLLAGSGISRAGMERIADQYADAVSMRKERHNENERLAELQQMEFSGELSSSQRAELNQLLQRVQQSNNVWSSNISRQPSKKTMESSLFADVFAFLH